MNNYCRNCNTMLNENGVCPNCGSVYSINPAQPVQEEQIFVDDNGVYLDANGNPLSPEQFNPVDLSNYYSAPQQNYAPAPEYPQQNYAPTAEYPQQNYASTPEYSQQNYAPNAGYPQQNYAPNAGYQQPSAPREMPAIIKEWLECAVKFFTKEPMESVDAVMNGTHLSWTIFAGLNAFFAALCMSGIVGNGFNKLIETIFGSYTFMMNFVQGYDFGQMFILFLTALVSFAVLFFAASACNYVFLTVVKKKAEFEDLFKVTAISYFPMTVACAAAFIFSFFLLPVSAVLLVAGFVASMMLLNESMKKLADDLPFWGMVISNMVQVIVTMIIAYIAIVIAL